MKLIMAQLDFLVGDIPGNTHKILQAIQDARDIHQADLIVFSELALTGYPPEDLLYRPDLYPRIAHALNQIKAATKGIDVILGYPEQTLEGRYNQAGVIREGELIRTYRKQKLPNYNVFDEVRYFQPGSTPCIVKIKNIPIAISVCEDLWFEEPMQLALLAGAKMMISLNASPFAKHKAEMRAKILKKRAEESHLPIVYVNTVGAQDELVFDGGSMVVSAEGEVVQQAPFFVEGLYPVEIAYTAKQVKIESHTMVASSTEEERVYKALVLGVRDYIEKNHFPRAVIGLSGGVDSALTLAIAVDAIGKDRVTAVMMPSRYTAAMSIEDATQQAQHMGVKYEILSIEPAFQAFLTSLEETFKGLPKDTTEENLQARCRGVLVMTISNKQNAIVLATGNKSEMSVGYSTLYGDMVGGFCVLKDVPKTLVYRLCNYRNKIDPAIPQRVLDRAPSAELAENQKDEDSLPPYSILDAILERYIEKDESIDSIVSAGFDRAVVEKVVKMIDRNEYKRRQAAPGVRISERAFGKDRRYPITSGFLNSVENRNI